MSCAIKTAIPQNKLFYFVLVQFYRTRENLIKSLPETCEVHGNAVYAETIKLDRSRGRSTAFQPFTVAGE